MSNNQFQSLSSVTFTSTSKGSIGGALRSSLFSTLQIDSNTFTDFTIHSGGAECIYIKKDKNDVPTVIVSITNNVFTIDSSLTDTISSKITSLEYDPSSTTRSYTKLANVYIDVLKGTLAVTSSNN